MIVECKYDELVEVPPGWHREAVLHISIGNQYQVLAIIIDHAGVFFSLLCDAGNLSHLPASCFSIVENSIPPFWIVNTMEPHASLVIGPPEIARNISVYEEVMEYDWDAVESLLAASKIAVASS